MEILLVAIIFIMLFGASKIKVAVIQFALVLGAIILGSMIFDALKSIPWWIWAGTIAFAVLLFIGFVLKNEKDNPSPTQAEIDREIDALARKNLTPDAKTSHKFDS